MPALTRSHSPVTQVVAIGIGAALFFVLGRFAAIPSPVPNTSINIQYAVLAVFAVLYGPLVGALAGIIGHVLIDATGYGIWISWELASGVFGLLVGLALLRHAIEDGEFTRSTAIRVNVAIVLANAVSWLLVAPLGDVVIYGEPAAKVWTQGGLSFIVNSLTACILGTIVLAVYARTRTRTGSLSREQ
ncbi:ECF-type riboflavin transporter substrate-binding protein [Brachybacterium squillarum]|uniref:ECF-type riboflavin transporter substrate-binding protein n=1 Tax=Brachybacterium squillarum TaxID=661979 RepID=UPI00222190F6|nr:ECF-type riboflavin transporter substrate-binding protein [Brachybacterium squillarum]MCW1806483.1 ECF-type riboflavin transporter substrate-binding protein [Brachybacterium squillarum]